jgi:hypothetical protein
MKNVRIAVFVTAVAFAAVSSARDNPAGSPSNGPGVERPDDRVAMTELRDRALMDSVRRQERELKVRQELQRVEFENRFAELVKAMNSFIKEYNDGKGRVWPHHQAEALGKAMHNVQDAFGRQHKR